jgi:hypothetical protein
MHTVVACTLCRLLARNLPRYENATPDRIWRHLLDAAGTVHIASDLESWRDHPVGLAVRGMVVGWREALVGVAAMVGARK